MKPSSVSWFFGLRTRTQRYDSDAPHRFERAEVAQHVHEAERVVVELALVEDAALARPAEEVLRAEDLPPQVVDGAHLGEEAVATDVEAPSVALDGAADSADDIVGFEDRDVGGVTGFHQLVRRGEAGRTGADDHDRQIGRRCFGGRHDRPSVVRRGGDSGVPQRPPTGAAAEPTGREAQRERPRVTERQRSRPDGRRSASDQELRSGSGADRTGGAARATKSYGRQRSRPDGRRSASDQELGTRLR